MSESKYISVIHKPSNKLVTAFKLESDAIWVGKERDDLIATANYCEPNKEVKMIFVKTYPKNNGKTVYAYFRAAPGESGLISDIPGESEEHKKSKQNIYEGIYSGEITINGETIDKNIVEDIYIEYRTSKSGYVIPDVLIKFKEEHIKYGLGIFIEIQLSKQHDEETLIRTYSRAIEGFSGIWLWKEDFDDNNNLMENNLKITTHRKLLDGLDKDIENKFIERINRYGEIIDKKFDNYSTSLWNYSQRRKESFEGEIKYISKNEINKLEIENEKLEELRELGKSLDTNSWKQSSIEFKEFTEDILKEGKLEIKNSLKNLVEKQINKLNKLCPIRQKPMKIGKAMNGYNWYCSDFPIKCDGIIKEVNFNED